MVRSIVSGISSGDRISTRNPGDNITIDDIWDTYLHVPGTKIIINKMIKAIYHNGFQKFDLDKERLVEIEKAHIFRDVFGYSAVAFRGDDIQAWNPKVQGIGFTMTNFDKDGICTEITVYNSAKLMSQGVPITDFIMLRTTEGLAGPMGLSKLLDLIDVLRSQNDIYVEYSKYAFHQGLAHPLLKVKNLDDAKYAKTQAAMSSPTKDDAVIIDIEDDFSYQSPMQNAYDPINMLEYGDTYVTRSSELNKLQLYGDPGGVLASSISAKENWYATVKEEQDRILSQIRPILIRLGSSEDIQFNDPAEYNIRTQMEGIMTIRQALFGLIEDQQVIDIINKFMGAQEGEELILKKQIEQPALEDAENEDDIENPSKDVIQNE